VRIRLLSPAEDEYAESMLFYLEESPKAADDFIEEVEAALDEIAEFPERYPISESDVRAKVLNIFPFTIFYRVKAGEVVVSSVSHQKRDEGHWRKR
jgi:plasmid stabilization system protein ParE